MFRILIFITLILVSIDTPADSFRCGRSIVKVGESINALTKKCGKPVRKYSSKEMVKNEGHQKRVGVSNWVYERGGKKDMLISVYGGEVIKIQVD